MHILYHHRTLGDGAEGIHIREMVKAFSALGNDVTVIGPVVSQDGKVKQKKSSFFSKVKRGLPTWLVELVEIAYGVFCLMNCLIKIYSDRPHFIYDRYALYNFGCVLAGRITSVPVFLEVNAPLAWERDYSPDEKLAIKSAAYEFERFICGCAFKTLVVSSPLKQHLIRSGVPEKKIMVLPNGANPETFKPSNASEEMLHGFGADGVDAVIGFTGIMRKWHGLELLLEAVSLVRKMGMNVFLLLVGDGPARKEIDKYAARLDLTGNYFITGRLPHSMVANYIALFDIAVAPSATFYASPMKVLEYMAIGKAVVVPNTDNFADFVDAGVNGEVFEDGNAESMADVIGSLVKGKDRCRALAHEARKKIETRLNWNWNALAVIDEFKKINRATTHEF